MTSIGLFISGIFAGWLAEWLFFTFYLNKKNKKHKIEPSKKDVSYTTVERDISNDEQTIDNLTKLKGIGPNLTENLANMGITSFKQLSAIEDDKLLKSLEN